MASLNREPCSAIKNGIFPCRETQVSVAEKKKDKVKNFDITWFYLYFVLLKWQNKIKNSLLMSTRQTMGQKENRFYSKIIAK